MRDYICAVLVLLLIIFLISRVEAVELSVRETTGKQLVLRDRLCDNSLVLKHITKERRAEYYNLEFYNPGVPIRFGCYTINRSRVNVIFEDGKQSKEGIPLHEFTILKPTVHM